MNASIVLSPEVYVISKWILVVNIETQRYKITKSGKNKLVKMRSYFVYRNERQTTLILFQKQKHHIVSIIALSYYSPICTPPV